MHTLCTRQSVSQAPGSRDCQVAPLLFGGSWNELLSTRNLSVPGFHPIQSHGGQYWEPLNEFYRSPFWMKNKCFALILFSFYLFSPFKCLCTCIWRGDSFSIQMLGHAMPTDLAVSMEFWRPSLWVRCVPACIHTSPKNLFKMSHILHRFMYKTNHMGNSLIRDMEVTTISASWHIAMIKSHEKMYNLPSLFLCWYLVWKLNEKNIFFLFISFAWTQI